MVIFLLFKAGNIARKQGKGNSCLLIIYNTFTSPFQG